MIKKESITQPRLDWLEPDQQNDPMRLIMRDNNITTVKCLLPKLSKLLPLLLILMWIFPPLAARNLTYIVEGDLELHYPEEWTITDVNAASAESQDHVLIGTRDTGSSFENRFDLVIEPSVIPLTQETLGNLERYYEEEIPRSSGIDIGAVDVRMGKAGPHRLILGRYEHQLPGIQDNIITDQFYIPSEGRTFILTFVTTESDHDALSGDFMLMASSLKDLSATVSEKQPLPDWLQLALAMFGLLIVFLVGRAIYAAWKRSKEETVIHRHAPSYPPSETTYRDQTRDMGYPRQKQIPRQTPPRPQPTPRRIPDSKPQPDERKPTRASSKSIWPLIIFGIIIFNIIRQCVQN